jgi:hypothetical protein
MRHMNSRSLVSTVIACVASIVCIVAQADDQTIINESLFRLSLPGKWQGAYDSQSDSWQYRSADGREAVTVGILRRTTGPSVDSIKADFDAYLQARRKSERDLGGPKLRLGDPEVQERGAAVLARYTGVDPRNNRRTLTRVIVNEVAAGSFYYEATGFTASAFDARAKIVLGKVGLIGK